MLTIRAMSGGVGYAGRHLEHSDYYDEQRRVQGEWHGRGAELLGLRWEVTSEQFEAIREGLHPETGEFLRPRHSSDKTLSDGTEHSMEWTPKVRQENKAQFSVNGELCHGNHAEKVHAGV